MNVVPEVHAVLDRMAEARDAGDEGAQGEITGLMVRVPSMPGPWVMIT